MPDLTNERNRVMVVNELAAGKQYLPIVQQRTSELDLPKHDGVTFKDTLSELVDDVNSLQVDAAEQKEKLIKGEPVDLHDVMISAQKAKTSFELLLELRNKGLDLYREVMRMQV